MAKVQDTVMRDIGVDARVVVGRREVSDKLLGGPSAVDTIIARLASLKAELEAEGCTVKVTFSVSTAAVVVSDPSPQHALPLGGS